MSLLLAAWVCAASAWAQDPFADAVASFSPGTHAGFGADELPGIVLGPPRGAGLIQGSFDVVSLGNDGVVVLRFDLPVICDGPGTDFTVFENAFHAGAPSGPIFADYGIVAVSQDGERFVDLPYDAVTHSGLAGQAPVSSHPDNDIDPLDPSVSGGDLFDLAGTGLAWAAYVRITDPGATIPDPGNQVPQADNSGFDLDAIAALHACDPSSAASSTPTFTPTPTQADPTTTSTPTPSADQTTPTASMTPNASVPSSTPTSTATATASPTADSATATATMAVVVPGDLDGDGSVTAADAVLLIAEIYDGDGVSAAAAVAADVNGDGRITAADLTALAVLRSP